MVNVYIITNMYIATADSPDADTTQVQLADYELSTQNEELQELLEDEDVTVDNVGM